MRAWFRGVAAALALLSLSAGGGALAAPSGRPHEVEFGRTVPMRDGVRLSAMILRPPGEVRPAPTVLIFTPYGADRFYPVASYFAQEGFSAAIVEVRGRGDSEGVFKPYVNDAQDVYDTIEWLADQPFSDGRVVMRGASYTGAAQWLAAAMRPPALKTVAAAAASYQGLDAPNYRGVGLPYRARWGSLVAGRQRNTNWNGDTAFWNGLFAELGRGDFPFAALEAEAGLARNIWPEALAHPVLDSYWRALNPRPEQLAAVEIPILVVTGVNDGAQLGTIEHYRRLIEANPAAAARTRFLMGPWDHAGVTTPNRRVGGFDFGADAELDMLALHLAWYRHVLDGAPAPQALKGPVTYYLAGANAWRGAQSLDGVLPDRVFGLSSPEGVADRLDRAGALGAMAKPGDRDAFTYDPARAAIAWGPYFGSATGEDWLRTDAFLPILSGDGLVFESAPFARGADLIGQARLDLTITLNVPDTDLAAVLYDVAPDGALVRLGYDTLRARYRAGFEAPSLVPIGEPQSYRLNITWTAHRLAPGHRLRLLVTAPGVSYLYQRNRNSGGDPNLETAADGRVARIRVDLANSRLAAPLQELGGPP